MTKNNNKVDETINTFWNISCKNIDTCEKMHSEIFAIHQGYVIQFQLYSSLCIWTNFWQLMFSLYFEYFLLFLDFCQVNEDTFYN